MTNDRARAILRLIAMTTVLIGVVLTTLTIIGVMAWGRATIAVADHEWSGAGMGTLSILAQASIIAWGLAFYVASPRLAEMATK